MTIAAEKAIATFGKLSKADQKIAFPAIEKLFKRKRVSEKEYFKPVSEEEFFKQAKNSLVEVKGGKAMTEEEFFKEMRSQYAI
ncbi:hypothetical protein IKE71_03530 [Candidatus Saccharibacteria bacterium]|nr:hypothetical protein [Candidatus Saccharibacteria bacterium]